MQAISEQQSQELCKTVSRYSPTKTWHRVALRLTYSIWRPLFSYILYELYNKGVLDSSRLHIANALIDRTQKHKTW